MGIFDALRRSRGQKDRELMNSFCLGFASDIRQLFLDEGFDEPNVLELVIFGMFVISETYPLATKRFDKANSQLDQFHLDMVNHLTNEWFLKVTTIKDAGDILGFHDLVYETVNSRYLEYRKLSAEDSRNPATMFSKTVGAFVRHLFTKPINKKESSLVGLICLKFVEFNATCIETFK